MAKKKEEATLFDSALTFEEALEELEKNVQNFIKKWGRLESNQ